MPFIETVIEEQAVMYGDYHPNQKRRDRSVVMVRDVGCVFIGSIEQCQQYIRDNSYKYEKKNSRRLLTV